MRLRRILLPCLLLPLLGSCDREPEYDLLVRGGTIYDGTGSAGFAGDVAIKGDRIATSVQAPARQARDRRDGPGGLSGFITCPLVHRIASMTGAARVSCQGVTLEVMGEGDLRVR
jgi:N-acyl-D-amino-acid deacylase